MTSIADSPFGRTRESYGRTEHYLDTAAFGDALLVERFGAEEIGERSERGPHGNPVYRLPSGLEVWITRDHGAGKGARVILRSGGPADLRRQLTGSYNLPAFPEVGVDTSRPLDVLQRDVQRRLIDAAAEPLAQLLALAEKERQARADLDATAAMLRAACPALDVTTSDKAGAEASLRYYRGDFYFTGRLSASGSIYIDRLGGFPAERLPDVLAALTGAAKAEG